ncbi:ParB N-terminal domain-containing protein [Metallosphaera hakonensis]|uniref:Nuclease n=1 Tax=Metallosphaera hakonensis JCM 8857 = DSM 7519 TaxID=1293036 RepID=A0A2U9IUA9_9CREN|nr:ParB N-terminal domain-containing protein [Metallosphaera hakonensis]AWR99626.1 nuclease [Metallosphaera hakonensis JCM 8857 = DSM 7519]
MTAADITLDYVDPRDLKPHEDILRNKINDTIISIRETKSVIPIIVDEDSYLVIDGHHRREAIIMLGYRKIPAYMIRYLSPRVNVEIWYRRFSLTKAVRAFLQSVESDGGVCATIEKIRICSNSVFETYWKLEWIEQMLRKLGISIDRNPAEGLRPPSLDKEIILKIASKGKRLPPKSSRHLYDFIIQKERVRLQ